MEFPAGKRGAVSLIGALLLILLAPASATADRAATKSEAKAIRKAFLKDIDGRAKIRSIRVSTKDAKFAAVSYSVRVEEPAGRVLAAKSYRAPVPTILKKKSKRKWKPAGKVPGKVDKELGSKAKSDIRISGDVEAHLKRLAPCSAGGGYYTSHVYEKGTDTYFSVQIPSWNGYGYYPARAVHSVASLSVGNGGTTPMWETGQGSDAYEPSGALWVYRGWGIIEATMAQTGGGHPQTVSVSGTWACG